MNTANKTAWILFISRRFARIDAQSRGALTAFLSSLGIAFGVMTLIVVMAVMNGFQMGYIESILEIHSFHVRAKVKNQEESKRLTFFLSANPLVRSFMPFTEAQALTVGKNGRQEAALIRFIPENSMQNDSGFASQVHIVSGSFDISSDKAVVGSALARSLGLTVGDNIHLLALSGSSDVELLSADRVFTVSGIFSCSYSEINGSFVFFSSAVGKRLLGESEQSVYGIKLKKLSHDSRFLSVLHSQLPNIAGETWRTYNRSFFGALKIEKNVLMLLVFLIFVVVGVNIFNSMRRMVFERREEIAVLSALGAPHALVQAIFLMQGLFIGLGGAVPGLLLGMLISVRTDTVFWLISKALYYVQYAQALLFNSEQLYYVTENPMFMFYAQIPARMFFPETAAITLFGVLAALAASYAASTHILKLSVAEVLRYE